MVNLFLYIFFYIKGKVTTQLYTQVILCSFLVLKHNFKAKTSFTNFHRDGLKRKARHVNHKTTLI